MITYTQILISQKFIFIMNIFTKIELQEKTTETGVKKIIDLFVIFKHLFIDL